MNRRAFTLLELLIVVSIIGILATVSAPWFQSNDVQSLEAAARFLGGDLRMAQHLSIQHNTEWTVQFDLKQNTYRLMHTGTGSVPNPPRHLVSRTGTNGQVVDLNDLGSTRAQHAPVRIDSIVLRDSRTPVEDVTLRPTGGTKPQRNEDTVIVLAQDHGNRRRHMEVVVSWVTGQVWVEGPMSGSAGGP